MRILHTSDWHLGRGLHGQDLGEAHAAALDQVVEAVESHDVDVVVVAGDVYDRAIPPVGAVALLNRTLERLCRSAAVIVTPGNHDSAVRLGFGSGLFGENLHIRSDLNAIHEPVVLRDDHGTVAFYPLPFLDPQTARSNWDPEGQSGIERSHQAVFEHAMDRVRDSAAAAGHDRCVVVAHAFVVAAAAGGDVAAGDESAAEVSESERDLSVGGIQTVTADVFAGMSYVALGHLHGAQQPRTAVGSGPVRYSGSPLRFSFSEARHTKSVTLVDLAADGSVELSELPLDQPRGMSRIRGAFDDLVDPDGPHADRREDWVEITVTDATRPDEMAARLRQRFPHMLLAKHVPDRTGLPPGSSPGGDISPSASPMEILTSFVTDLGGAPPTAAEREVLEDAVHAIFGAGA